MVAFYASGMPMPDFTRPAAGTELLLVGRTRVKMENIGGIWLFHAISPIFLVDDISIFFPLMVNNYPPYPSIM